MIEYGEVHDVRLSWAGSHLAADAGLGSTTITVEDSVDFSEDGGTLQVSSLGTDGVTLVTTQYAYTALDPDAEVITLASGLLTVGLADDRVDALPASPDKQAVVLLTTTGDALTARVPHALNDLMPEGIRDDASREFVSVELVGTTWVVTDILAQEPQSQPPTVMSQNFVSDDDPGDGTAPVASGWLMDDEQSVFTNAKVAGTLGAGLLTAGSLQLGGMDLQNDLLSPLPLGTIVHVTPPVGVDSAQIGVNERLIFTINAGTLYPDRLYRMSYIGYFTTGSLVVNDSYTIRLRYTTDGTVPTLTSPIMPRTPTRVAVDNASQAPVFQWANYFTPPDGIDPNNTYRFAFSVQRAAGTGTTAVDVSTDRFEFNIDDMGLAANVGGSITQVSKASGTVDTTPPPATYTKSYTAINSHSYDGDNGPLRAGDPNTTDCYQGYYSSTHGKTTSLVNFDYNTIQNQLAGATTIKKVTLTFRVKHAYYNSGMNVHITKQNNTGLPSTGPSGSASGEIGIKTGAVAGATYTVDVTNSNLGQNLRDGTATGIGFWAPTTSLLYYGYMYGAGSSSPPKLTITYTK